MKYILIYLTLIFLIPINIYCNPSQKWVIYKSDLHGFKVMFPKSPKENTQTTESEWGSIKSTTLSFNCLNDKQSTNDIYLLGYSEYPIDFFKDWKQETFEEYFRITIEGMVNHVVTKDGKLLGSKSINFQGYQGREVKISHINGKEITIIRFFLKENNLYSLNVTTSFNQYPNADIQTFFDSFEFLNTSNTSSSSVHQKVVEDFKNWKEGNKMVFNSKNHQKAKGLVFQIKYLNSWEALEADRPNIVQKFAKKIGPLRIGYAILVKKTKIIPTKDEIDYFVNNYGSTLPSNFTLLSKNENMQIDGERALLVEYRTESPANQTILGFPVVTFNYNYEVFYKDYIISLIFSATSIEEINKNELFEIYNEYKPFFKVLAASFVLESKWN